MGSILLFVDHDLFLDLHKRFDFPFLGNTISKILSVQFKLLTLTQNPSSLSTFWDALVQQ